jgi:hypothetical protein
MRENNLSLYNRGKCMPVLQKGDFLIIGSYMGAAPGKKGDSSGKGLSAQAT